jgi:glycosyltransferase involved in cell wall biosynthesis
MAGKRKILLMSDDIRMHSGVATQSKEFVIGTMKHYDWVQIGGAVEHPESGKIIDMNDSVRKETGVKDAYLKIYPITGYGNADTLREIISMEKPDAILHFTDPRQWIWLYQMEHEIRQNIPIFYYNIWDDLPDPKYNRDFYRSSDLLMSISKQTYGLNYRILKDYGYTDNWKLKYVPHGVGSARFKKINPNSQELMTFQQKYGLHKYKFKILYLNRNIRRKCPGDVALAYKHMMDKLTPEQRKDCVFVFHASPSDENGTDMRAVCQTLLPEYPVIFTYDMGGTMKPEDINLLYNSVDVYINLASNEGFGLGSLEALTVGTPIVVNVTGGMQDQCGFQKRITDENNLKHVGWKYLTADDYIELGSNHRGKYKQYGEWVKPIFPSNISLQGSPMTPYIFDDRASYEDAGEALLEWYNEGPEERERKGEVGRQWVLGDDAKMTAEHLSQGMIESMDTAFEKWTPREKYTLEAV